MDRKLDLIDRNALYEKAYFHGKLPDPGCLYPDGKEAVDVDDIDVAPSIDAVPVKHGKWNIDKSFMPFICTCSECGAVYDIDGAFDWYYCPNCGTCMVGGNV